MKRCPECNTKMVKASMNIGNMKEVIYQCPKCKKKVKVK